MAIIQPHYATGRTILADVIPLATPFTVQVEVSQLCNLRCNYCIQSFKEKRGKQMMSWDTFELLCDQIREFPDKLKQLNFAGWGEPLINPRLPRLIRHVKTMGIAENIAIVTNGLLLTPQLTISLITAGVDHIRISLQGMRATRYWEVSHKRMIFSHLVDKIKFLYEHKGSCQVSVKLADAELTREDEDEFYQTFNYICDRMYVEQIRPVFEKEDDQYISKFGKGHNPVNVCPHPFYMLAIAADGEVIPCCSFYNPVQLGNIKEWDLLEMWNSLTLRHFRLTSLSRTPRKQQTKYPVCASCNIPDVIITPEDELDNRMVEVREQYERS
jgi:radical SAM protein with 4Fe4S-binding SPASM domain